jgi:hypothetical protein
MPSGRDSSIVEVETIPPVVQPGRIKMMNNRSVEVLLPMAYAMLTQSKRPPVTS